MSPMRLRCFASSAVSLSAVSLSVVSLKVTSLCAAALFLASCGEPAVEPAVSADAGEAVAPSVGEATFVVPSAGLPGEVTALNANNNLDVVRHDGRVFLAYRTAPWHFAHEDVWLYVISSADQAKWRFEGKFHLGTDLREPRFLSWNGSLWLFFAVLGKDLGKFEPGDARVAKYGSPGNWTEAKSMNRADFIPWRARVVDGKPYLIGYNNGGDVYAGGKIPNILVKVLTTEDGETWTPAFGDAANEGVVLKGGVSEVDFAFTPDGGLVAVGRNEAGDELGFGSKICTAKAGALGDWTCSKDPRKYDSPLVFTRGGKVWLIGRRSIKNEGLFDLGHSEKPHAERYTDYQVAWWAGPKRCSLWSVDPASRKVTFVLDLPSKGDTCFASIVDEGADGVSVYNYTSPLDGKDVNWQTGQFGPTLIYRVPLSL